MKVLIINSVINRGSTGKICYGIAREVIKNGGECVVAYGRNSTYVSDVPCYKIGGCLGIKLHAGLSRITDKHALYSTFATRKLVRFIKKYKPDVINLHNLHGYYINVKVLFKFLKTSGIRVVWTLHDCWAFTGHCAYYDYAGCNKWQSGCNRCPSKKQYPKSVMIDGSKRNYNLKRKLFTGVPSLTVVTPSMWLKGEAEKSFLKDYSIRVINNGVNLSVFKPTESDIRKEFEAENKKIVFASANVWEERKGLKYVKQLAKLLPQKQYEVIVCGADEEYFCGLQNVSVVPRTESAEKLAAFYTAADVFINPTLEDNFPSSNIEAIACGTPVVTFPTGGSGECITDALGAVTQEKSAKSLFAAVTEGTGRKKDEAAFKSAAENYAEEKKFGEYVKLFGDMCK